MMDKKRAVCDNVRYVRKRLVISGSCYELYEYGKGYYLGGSVVRNAAGRRGNGEITAKEREENRQRCLKRARTRLRRLVNANHGQYGEVTTKFLTLTFAKEVDVSEGHRQFKNFIKRLNWALGYKTAYLKYIAVVETEPRIHYHLLLFNAPYIPAARLAEIWGRGFVKINRVAGVSNVGAYVCKYMTKDFLEGGSKSYLCSRGLLRPREVVNEDADQLGAGLRHAKVVYAAQFENEHLGRIDYTQFDYKPN